ncbi:MAG: tRNA lysidine(34) synthetase TilS [Gammaproteobacteria bacterium]
MAFTPEDLRERLAALPAVDEYQIAFSGGLDSTVLLHALTAIVSGSGPALQAVHVHHALHPQADNWAEHCRQVCAALDVPFRLVRVDAGAKRGESPEAAAREARYRALRSAIKAGVCLLTAHQQDDQAETLLLQLLRGSGPAGLAAMPGITRFGDGWHVRPLLDFTRRELADYAAARGLSWIDDPSNWDIEPDRNFIRHEIMAALRARWPSSTRTLARAAGLQAEVSTLLGELANQDLAVLAGSRADTLSIAALRGLSGPRQRNAIRHWLIGLRLPLPTQTQLEHVLIGVVGARGDRSPVIAWHGVEVRRYRDNLYAMPPLPAHDPNMVLPWDTREPLNIPHLGVTLESSLLESSGIADAAARSDITIRFRRGGERCRPRGRRHHHDLKKLFQEAGVPPWERDRIPLVYVGERLTAVIGYWECE